MNCEAQGNLRHRARTSTALATIALVAGGHLAIAGVTADSAAAASINKTGKESKLIAASATSNAANKGGRLGAEGASSNEARKGGMLSPARASTNESRKGGKLIAKGAGANASRKQARLPAPSVSSNASVKQAMLTEERSPQAQTAELADTEVIVKYNTIVTSTNAPPGVTKVDKQAAEDAFRPNPKYEEKYDAKGQVDIYGAKTEVIPPRPLLELGRQQYTSGEYSESSTLLGELNPLLPGLHIYGDWRTAVAYNQNNGDDVAQIATRLNLDVDFKITGTERIHAFFTPIQDNGQFTRCEFGGGGVDDEECELEFDGNPQTLFLEGDVGQIYAGLSGAESSFDLPFTVGLFPLFLQNGIWANDAILGGAFTIPAQNSASLGLANFDVTFFAAYDNIDNQSVVSDVSANRNNNIANLYGVTAFIDAFDGYIETGYGLIDGFDEADGLVTHFLTAAYTRRYYNTLSNSTRVFANFGDGDDNDGLAIISENSLISGLPSTLLPYANFFVGFGNPQPLVDGNGAGILKNVGINFETDALTGFPKLDDTGTDTYGGAIGIQYLFNLDQQIVFEVATVQPHGDQALVDEQYALGVRYQIPLSKAWLFRADATYQFLEGQDEDNWGIRSELRRKF